MRNSVAHENEAARRDSDETMDYDAWRDAAYANAGDGARRDGFHHGTARAGRADGTMEGKIRHAKRRGVRRCSDYCAGGGTLPGGNGGKSKAVVMRR